MIEAGWRRSIASLTASAALIADEVHVLEVARVPPLAVGKRVTIGSAMGVGRSDQDVIGRNAADLRTHAISQHRWKPDQVEGHDGHGDVALSEDDGPGRDLSSFFPGWVGCAHPARDGQERVRRDHTHRGADLNLALERGTPQIARQTQTRRIACDHGRVRRMNIVLLDSQCYSAVS